MKSVMWAGLAVALLSLVPSESQSAVTQETASRQGEQSLQVLRDDGTVLDLPIREDRGYSVISHAGLIRLGWTVSLRSDAMHATFEGRSVSFVFDTPFFQWDGDILQFVRPPYVHGGSVWLPLQFFLDFLPARIPERYGVSALRQLLVKTGHAVLAAEGAGASPAATDPDPGVPDPDVEADRPGSSSTSEAGAQTGGAPDDEVDPTWGLVVIDPGHGGRDPGAIGPGGRREKDIALSIGRALAREVGRREGLEVRLTRDRDRLIPLWERGHMATEWKRDRPGIFISIHVNSLPDRPSVRGFETYFLSEARTEHEARVAENENAPLALRDDDVVEGAEAIGLDFILRSLRNRDHQRWSAILADEVQRGMESVHPGPSRGVKQAPFAVITNALMPAILIEVGFVTNPNEERLLSRVEFQRSIAVAIAEAIDRFFERYPQAGASSGGHP